jgi:hypothetical protein
MTKIQWTKDEWLGDRINADNGLGILSDKYLSAAIDGTGRSTVLRFFGSAPGIPLLTERHDGRIIAKEIARRVLAASATAERAPDWSIVQLWHHQHSMDVYSASADRMRAEIAAAR